MKIIISGLTACGKTYQAKKIAKEFNLKYFGASEEFLKTIGQTTKGHFWIKQSGLDIFTKREKDHNLDKQLDNKLMNILDSQDNLIVDSWVLPWIYQGESYKIYIRGSLDLRAKISLGSKEERPFNLDELKKRINLKDQRSILIFKEIYGVNIEDLSIFDLIVDSHPSEPQKVVDQIIRKIKEAKL